MDAGLIDRIESGAERSASALFAGAVAYAAYGLLVATGVQPQVGLAAAGVGALAYLPCSKALRAIGCRGGRFRLPDFAVPELAFAGAPEELLLTERLAPEELVLTERLNPDELVLTENDRVDARGPLDLDDILAEMGPDSRVVRLFDPKAMPTPGQLHARIDDHLEDGTAQSAPSDASQALSAALAELRRSLR
jgi:hypothetical protein